MAPGDPNNRVEHVGRGTLLLAGLVALLGAGVSLLSWLQPWFADDFASPLVLAEYPGLIDVARHNYEVWGGRLMGTIFGWVAFTYRPVYAITVGVAFLAVAALLVAIGLGHLRPVTGRALVLVALAAVTLWFGMPALGHTVVWLSGSTAYLMTFPLMLGFLLPFRVALGEPAPEPASLFRAVLNALLMLALGLALGLTHESAIAGTAVALVLMLALAFRRGVVRQLPAHLWAGSAGLVIGGLLLVLAPGTAVRADAVADVASGLGSRLAYIAIVLGKGAGFVLPQAAPWLLGVALLAAPAVLIARSDATRVFAGVGPWPVIWLSAAGGALLPFLVVPSAGEERIYSFTFVFLALSAFSLFAADGQLIVDRLPSRALTVATALLLALALAEVGGSALLQRNLAAELATRNDLIAEQLADGRSDIIVPPLVTQPHRAVPYMDITVDPDDSRNVLFAEYRGIDSIRIGQEP